MLRLGELRATTIKGSDRLGGNDNNKRVGPVRRPRIIIKGSGRLGGRDNKGPDRLGGPLAIYDNKRLFTIIKGPDRLGDPLAIYIAHSPVQET